MCPRCGHAEAETRPAAYQDRWSGRRYPARECDWCGLVYIPTEGEEMERCVSYPHCSKLSACPDCDACDHYIPDSDANEAWESGDYDPEADAAAIIEVLR